MTMFTYTLALDYGFAPNPFRGSCTLACCKPRIRGRANVGDLVVGVGGVRNKLAGKIIYAMVVNDRMTFDEYWNHARFQSKKPNIHGGHKGFFGDNIYCKDKKSGKYRQSDSHHSKENGIINRKNYKRDLSVDQVLVSYDYVYFGVNAVTPPLTLCDGLRCDFPHWARDYFKSYPGELRHRVEKWLRDGYDWELQGLPERWVTGNEMQKG